MQNILLLSFMIAVLLSSCGCKGGIFTAAGRQHIKSWAYEPAPYPKTDKEIIKQYTSNKYVYGFKPPSRAESYGLLKTGRITINQWQDYQILRDEEPTYFNKKGFEVNKYSQRPEYETMSNIDPLTFSLPRKQIWGK